MQKTEIEWHPYPQEDLPMIGRYFLTIRGHYGNFVDIFRISPEKEWMRKFVVAWAELPNPYDKRRKKDSMVNWNPYPDEIPSKNGYYLTTSIYKRKKYIETRSWFLERREFDEEDDENIIAWSELPEPYKDDNL